ncbi:ABC transporter ATP-binding protein [Microbacterium sp. CFBP9034]|uniref:ABC transporter ATP-binding protein n=1 Tax=Microbacterium sp. CFBP9034 TaxID=3096540 RepID=UPI002A6AA0FB|nr:ATP-binding cassette domain-containing protein [Microbacterium sp. CFBP9034]MDY0910173.1 ATP-binding cassette domain-containing protein [Microbacterium sp. CFBP9034]
MIEIENLRQVFGDKVAVDDVSFTVRPGSVTGLLGPNGAGKSTTMRMIVGLDHPAGGSVRVNGSDFRESAHPLRDLGALLDPTAVHPGRSGRMHLRAIAATNSISTARVDEVLRLTGMTDAAHRRIGTYSLGMRQRIGIAAALLGDPRVLVLDEPVNGLDPDGVHWVRQLMKGLAADGRTVLVSSHLMSEMALTADHLVVMGRGRLITQGPVSDVIAQRTQSDVLVRSPDAVALGEALTAIGATVRPGPDGALLVTDTTAARVGEVAASRSIVLHELTPHQGSLEDAFLALTQDDREYTAGSTAVQTEGAPR